LNCRQSPLPLLSVRRKQTARLFALAAMQAKPRPRKALSVNDESESSPKPRK
jgi:hypothetical protein